MCIWSSENKVRNVLHPFWMKEHKAEICFFLAECMNLILQLSWCFDYEELNYLLLRVNSHYSRVSLSPNDVFDEFKENHLPETQKSKGATITCETFCSVESDTKYQKGSSNYNIIFLIIFMVNLSVK